MSTEETGAAQAGKIEHPGSVTTWIAMFLACAYILWICRSLYYSTPIFINMYSSMGVDLPTPTLFVITAYRWLYPLLFAGAVILVIAKQFFVRQKWVSLTITMAVVLAVNFIANELVLALYRPMFDLMEKLNK